VAKKRKDVRRVNMRINGELWDFMKSYATREGTSVTQLTTNYYRRLRRTVLGSRDAKAL